MKNIIFTLTIFISFGSFGTENFANSYGEISNRIKKVVVPICHFCTPEMGTRIVGINIMAEDYLEKVGMMSKSHLTFVKEEGREYDYGKILSNIHNSANSRFQFLQGDFEFTNAVLTKKVDDKCKEFVIRTLKLNLHTRQVNNSVQNDYLFQAQEEEVLRSFEPSFSGSCILLN